LIFFATAILSFIVYKILVANYKPASRHKDEKSKTKKVKV